MSSLWNIIAGCKGRLRVTTWYGRDTIMIHSDRHYDELLLVHNVAENGLQSIMNTNWLCEATYLPTDERFETGALSEP